MSSVAETDTVGDLKALVFSQTTIPVERQKILNLCKGKLPEDDTVLAHLNLQDRPKKEFNVLGTNVILSPLHTLSELTNTFAKYRYTFGQRGESQLRSWSARITR
jgi:hypothetical protein